MGRQDCIRDHFGVAIYWLTEGPRDDDRGDDEDGRDDQHSQDDKNPDDPPPPPPPPKPSCPSEIFVDAKPISTSSKDVRKIKGDKELDSDDWTSVELSYSVSKNSRDIQLVLIWAAQEHNADRSLGDTRIESMKTIPLFDLRSQGPGCAEFRISGMDILPQSDQREHWYKGEAHGQWPFPPTGALTQIGVKFDAKGRQDQQVQALEATFAGFSLKTQKN